ncbi:uncharacterized protein METZ01_LOCUS315444 [marine metagenome]|uniref:Uncharacterized protein n=1 Tax=marine metagenome TaxID=408172 RepID=A0A382NPQ4_9ZZZZ
MEALNIYRQMHHVVERTNFELRNFLSSPVIAINNCFAAHTNLSYLRFKY